MCVFLECVSVVYFQQAVYLGVEDAEAAEAVANVEPTAHVSHAEEEVHRHDVR